MLSSDMCHHPWSSCLFLYVVIFVTILSSCAQSKDQYSDSPRVLPPGMALLTYYIYSSGMSFMISKDMGVSPDPVLLGKNKTCWYS